MKTDINYQNYYAKTRILHDGEMAFYQVLNKIIEPTNIIFCKVRLEDIIGAKDNEWKEINRNRIKSKHIDFVVYDQEKLRIKIAIELDGREHLKKDQRKKDEFKDRLFYACKIPLVRIPYSHYYDENRLKDYLNQQYEAVNGKFQPEIKEFNIIYSILDKIKALFRT